jgi:DNA polymerase III subunit epsilon
MDRRSFLAGVLSSPLIAILFKAKAEAATRPALPYTVIPATPDTEATRLALKISTTGADPQFGHYIYEIAAVRIAGHSVAGLCFHQYLRSPSEIDPGYPSYGAPPWFLRDDIHFGQIANQFVECLRGKHIVVHNARLELAFLDHELRRAGLKTLKCYCASVTDTIVMAKQAFSPSIRCCSLESLCKRMAVEMPDRSSTHQSGSAYAGVVAHIYIAMKTENSTLYEENK